MVMNTPMAKPRKLLTDTMTVATNPKCLNTNLFSHSQLLIVAFDEVTDPKPASDTLMKSGKSDTRVFGVVVEVDDVNAGVEMPPLVVDEAVHRRCGRRRDEDRLATPASHSWLDTCSHIQ